MKHLIDETNRRRKIQVDYNKKNNIIPETIIKNIEKIKSSTIVADKEIDTIIRQNDSLEFLDLDSLENKEMIKKPYNNKTT